MSLRSLRCPIGVLAVVILSSAPPAAQQPLQRSSGASDIANGQVVRTAAATVRVSAISGFVYPWALAFLPNGDMLVTEQGRNTLRLVRRGVLDPTPVTGLPQGITSTRRDTAGVDIATEAALAAENARFPYEIRQLNFGLCPKPTHRIVYTIRPTVVAILRVRHLAQQEIAVE